MAPIFPFNLLRRPPPLASLAPDAPLVAIGDIHGRADLLEELLDLLAERADRNWPLVCLGDYIDRGEQSAKVLRMLRAGLWSGPMICLKGNHEAMMLDFMDDPERVGPFWLRHGGTETLESFGIAIPDILPEALFATRDRLQSALPDGTETWLRTLPLSYRSGNVLAVHAGIDPRTAIAGQEDRTLLWGHPEFLHKTRRDGLWVAHGHTITDTPLAAKGRISLDTGAYVTHRLTAALITQGMCDFVTTRD